uniref:Uncharacterized protein n=1 Tax=Ixodes ricinus TaxID=34613 RepID=A0A6B0UUF0_IXORI
MNSGALPLYLAMLARRVRPMSCCWSSAATQRAAESPSTKSTKATPLLFQVCLSFITVTLATLPYFSNSWCRSLFVSLYGRLLTYTVLLLGVRPALIVAGTPGTRNQSRNKPTRTRPSKLEQIMLVLSCGPATQVKRLLHNKP